MFWLLAWASFFQPALAMTGDTFQPYLSYSYSYDDNLFRLPSSQVVANGKSDTYQSAEGGIMIDKSYSKQHLTASLNVNRTTFNQHALLNNYGKGLQANLNWQMGNHLDGNVGASYSQSLTPYTEFHIDQRNLRTQERDYFDSTWHVHPSWNLHGRVSQYRLDYDLDSQKPGNRTEDTGELGLDYVAPSNSTIGVLYRHTRGGFPVLQQIVTPQNGTQNIDNSYSQDEYKGKIDWTFSGKTHLQFLGGWVERKHATFPARDTKGPGVRLNVNWLFSGKTGIDFSAWREIYASEDLTVSYTLNKGISLAPRWDVVSKVRLEGLYKFEKRDYSSATAFPFLPPSNRLDTSRYASISLTYFALQNLQIGASVFLDTLDTNIPQSDYRAKGMMINFRSVF